MELHGFELHGFWRSLATYRVRIALNLKGLAFTEDMHDLDRGDQHVAEFRALNPAGAVPALIDGNGPALTQSLAILEYLDETHPAPPLLPQDARDRARVRALCAVTAADSHPLVVPRVQAWLATEWGIDEGRRLDWSRHWFTEGLAAYEALLPTSAGAFCHGDAVTMADLCLASHCAGAQRFGLQIASFPTVERILGACMVQEAFASAHPTRQPGAPS